MALPMMPKATAVWLVDNTALTFEQIAEFCGMHVLEVKAIADDEVATGILGLDPMAIRYTLLASHYRQNMNFTFEGIEASAGAIRRLKEFVSNMEQAAGDGENPGVAKLIENVEADFEAALDDDLNIAGALGLHRVK